MTAWYAQAGQDEWVAGLHPEPGYFVDVGAHDGVTHSNTYALEQMGWTGLCIEPNAEAYAELVKNRTCLACPLVASSFHNRTMVPFDGVRVGTGTPTLAMPLHDMLEGVGAFSVDYLSIDVEGHELEVLHGVVLNPWRVKYITIEHNLYCDGPARKDAIYAHLTAHGFERVREDVVAPGYGPYECWYVNRSLM